MFFDVHPMPIIHCACFKRTPLFSFFSSWPINVCKIQIFKIMYHCALSLWVELVGIVGLTNTRPQVGFFSKWPTRHPNEKRLTVYSSENVTKKLVCRNIRESNLPLLLTSSWTDSNLDWHKQKIQLENKTKFWGNSFHAPKS